MKKVSVILPVFNGEDNLSDAIDSILNQSYKELQLIVVDDCSNDGTYAIAKEYAVKDNRVIIVRNEQNLKLPASLNVGFRHAEGEYLTWTSDDNIYKPDAIKIMVDFLEKNAEYGMVYCDMMLIDGEGKRLRENSLPDPEKIFFGNVVGACFLYRRMVADQVGEYDEMLFLAEDYDYWIRIYQKYAIGHLKQCLYYYRCHENSLSSTKRDMVKLQTCKVWDKHFSYIKKGIAEKRKLCEFFDYYVDFQGVSGKSVRKKLLKEYKFYGRHLLLKRIKDYL